MKNRPLTAHRKSPSRFSAVKTLVTSGFGLIGIGSLLLLTFFVSTNSINQQQDTQGRASVANGQVFISQGHTPGTPVLNQPNTFQLQMNTRSAKLEEVSLVFDVITDVTADITIEESNKNLFEYHIEKDDVDHGFKVRVTATPKNTTAGIMTANDQVINLINIKYTPTKPGTITLAYDRERSRAIVFGSNPKQDVLSHLPVYLMTVPGTGAPSPAPYAEDLSLVSNNLDSYFKFYETTGSRNEVNPRQLIKDRTYTVRHTARIQNINEDDTFATDPVIVNQLKVNDSESITRTFRRTDLTKSISPLEIQFETTFKAKEVNTVQVTIDSTNVFPEVNENNNSNSVSYSTSSSVKACNELCSSNADCGDNYTCHDLGSEKRCRLSTNLTSISCSANPDKHNLRCNQDCGDNNECGSGLTCFQNRCRNPYNTDNTSCVNPDSRAQQLIKDSCNQTCSDNRGCANNMRCFNGSCRLATNPSSTSCTAATESTVTSGYTKGGQPIASTQSTATPRPTATPRATATPRPAASATASATATPAPTPEPTVEPTLAPTPQPTPETKPNESTLETLVNRITNFMSSNPYLSTSMLTSAILPISVIGAGVLLLIVALVIVLRPSKKTHMNEPPYPTGTPSQPLPKPELHAKPNPPPPPIPGHGVIMPKKTVISDAAGTSIAATPIKQPDVIEMPPTPQIKPEMPKPTVTAPTPVAPPVPPATPLVPVPPVDTRPMQSMMQRLKEKGIAIPETKAGTPTQPKEVETAPNGDSQPPAAAWPEDIQK